MIPFLRVLGGAIIRFDIPGRVAADNMAEAIIVFLANCLLFIG
jgi:hypothetical protein